MKLVFPDSSPAYIFWIFFHHLHNWFIYLPDNNDDDYELKRKLLFSKEPSPAYIFWNFSHYLHNCFIRYWCSSLVYHSSIYKYFTWKFRSYKNMKRPKTNQEQGNFSMKYDFTKWSKFVMVRQEAFQQDLENILGSIHKVLKHQHPINICKCIQ